MEVELWITLIKVMPLLIHLSEKYMKYPGNLKLYFINSSGRKMSADRFKKLKTLLFSFNEIIVSRSDQWGSGITYRVESFERNDWSGDVNLKLCRKDDDVVP